MDIYSILNQQTVLPSANAGSASQTAEEIARANAEKEKVDFLNLLLTQLQNQNPLDPLDTKDFTAQLTRYSILEQGIETNEKLALTNDLLRTNATSSSFSYIGKKVEVETNANVVNDGKATWSYAVEGNASKVKLTVTDGDGNRIQEFDGAIGVGAQSFSIDAAQYGLSDGQELYLSIRATDPKDAKLNTATTAFISIDGVWTDQNQTYLTAGPLAIRSSDIIKLIDPPQAPQTPATII